MQPLGYMYKRVESRPDWLAAPQVRDIYSVSGCISRYFANYIPFWKHNGFWLFDSPSGLRAAATGNAVSLEGLKLFYYEGYELEYDKTRRAWLPYGPEQSFHTDIQPPAGKALEGFDITTFSVHTSPECSPLSCNSCAVSVETNQHCLVESFDEAKNIVESDRLGACEPGPYRIIAVYSVGDGTCRADGPKGP